MCQLIIRSKPSHNPSDPMTWDTGYVIAVVDDDHVWGSHETKEAWIAAGYAPQDWHGKLTVIRVPGVDKADFKHLAKEHIRDMSGLEKAQKIVEYRTRFASEKGRQPTAQEIADNVDQSAKVMAARRSQKLDVTLLDLSGTILTMDKAAVLARVR